jgi:hypothetical protein
MTNNLGLVLGFDPYGALHLDHSSQMEFKYATHSSIVSSGVESSRALFTVNEDPSSRQGVKVRSGFLNLTRPFWLESGILMLFLANHRIRR